MKHHRSHPRRPAKGQQHRKLFQNGISPLHCGHGQKKPGQAIGEKADNRVWISLCQVLHAVLDPVLPKAICTGFAHRLGKGTQLLRNLLPGFKPAVGKGLYLPGHWGKPQGIQLPIQIRLVHIGVSAQINTVVQNGPNATAALGQMHIQVYQVIDVGVLRLQPVKAGIFPRSRPIPYVLIIASVLIDFGKQ